MAVSSVDRFTLRAFTIGFTLLLLYLLWRIFQPFVSPILWATLLALILFPANAALRKKFKGKRGRAALVMTLVVLVGVVVPMAFLGMLFARQATDLLTRLSALATRYQIERPQDVFRIPALDHLVHWIDEKTPVSAADVQQWIVSTARSGLEFGLAHGKSILLGALGLVVSLVLMLVVLYFFFRDGDAMAEEFLAVLPTDPKRKAKLVEHLSSVTRAVVYGSLLTALVQGALVGIAFGVCGLPSPVVFGVIAAIAALLPVGGTAFVWAPGAIALFAQGRWGWGIAMVVWGAVVVSTVDNILRPYLISGRAEISTLPVFFGVLGGIAAFGPIGAFLGPVVIALALALMRYARDDQTAAAAESTSPRA